MTTPGIGFGRTADGYIRAALTVETPRLIEAVERIGKLKTFVLAMPSSLAYIALGSNLGHRRGILSRGPRGLGPRTGGVVVQKVSSFHETEPVGGPPGQGLFLERRRPVVDDT